MKSKTSDEKKPYRKPELKAVKIRPREVLGSECHNSMNSAPTDCSFAACSQDNP